ncbi:MAG: hypothetical protein AB7E26_03115 [Chryseobacterium sp.]
MKHLFTAAAMLFSMTAFAQVGINNTSPKATLDITAKTTDGSKPEGLIIPKLSGDNIHTATANAVYGAAQKGLIVYASSADTNPTGATANITAAGYYYFDGGAWQKVMTGSLANADLAAGAGGIYKGSGSLSGNTTVTQDANTLAFTSTATNGFSVDGTTLSVDAANDRVGIGTASPQASLHLLNSARFELPHRMKNRILKTSSDNGDLYWAPSNTNYGTGVSTTTASVANGASTTYTFTNTKGMIRISVGNTCGRYWQKDFDFDTTNSTIAFITGSGVGVPDGGGSEIMTSNSSYNLTGSMIGCADTSFAGMPTTISISGNTLTITNNTNVAKTFSITEFPYLSPMINLYTENGSLSSNRTVSQGANTLAFTSTATTGTSHFTVDGSTLNVDAVNNRVGIGTSTPATKLHTVSSSTYGAFQMQDGSEASGKFLSSNATGQATWVNSPLTPVAFGTLNTGSMTISGNKYLNSSITLTQGKWLVYVGLLLATTGTATNTDNTWVRLTLGSNNSGTGATQSGFSFLASSLVSGWLSTVNVLSGSTSKWTFINGVIPVNVTSSSQTIYLWTREISVTGTDPGATIGNNGENYLFAVPAY